MNADLVSRQRLATSNKVWIWKLLLISAQKNEKAKKWKPRKVRNKNPRFLPFPFLSRYSGGNKISLCYGKRKGRGKERAKRSATFSRPPSKRHSLSASASALLPCLTPQAAKTDTACKLSCSPPLFPLRLRHRTSSSFRASRVGGGREAAAVCTV